MEEQLWQHILAVRQQSPLVHNITNYVVMNNTANALLAAGASPIMAHAHPELEQMSRICQALVVNIGTLDEYWVQSMLIAATAARAHNKPWVLDPVGAGATAYRDTTLEQLLQLRPAVIRGNASEIMALARYNQATTKGVDSTAASSEAIEAARFLQQQYGAVVCISGATDIIIGEGQQVSISNGSPMMTKVTGLGCSASAITGAFVAIVPDHVAAVTAAMALLGIAGEIAAEQAAGPGSLQVSLLDKLYTLHESEFKVRLKITIQQ